MSSDLFLKVEELRDFPITSKIKPSARRIKAVAAGGVTEAATASPALRYEDITFAGEEMLTCVHRRISPT